MTATAVPVTRWSGCYSESWQDLITPPSFGHPAKAARGLAHRIYRHLLDSGYVRPGDTILDPFAGIGGFCLDAMTYGLHYVGIELEPKFVELGNKNLALWRQRYGFTGGTLVQGDSRRLREVLAGAQVGAVVGSPPYAAQVNQGGGKVYALWCEQHGRNPHAANAVTQSSSKQWGENPTPGQLGAMPPGALVSSPPYAGAGEVLGTHNGIDWSKAQEGGKVATPARQASGEGYGTSAGQLGAMPPGCVVSSPPWGDVTGNLPQRAEFYDHPTQRESSNFARTVTRGMDSYGTSPDQLGNTAGDTFWSASAQIMAELSAILPPGAVCAWVVKSYVSKKAIVPFPQQWQALCEAHGFVLVEEIHASLVEDHGTQEGLFGEAQRVTTERKSFFRRLYEKRPGAPRIDHETVLIVRKAGESGGVCVVSSPPWTDTQPLRHGTEELFAQVAQRHGNNRQRQGGMEQQGYGTTPGNLGNLPVGRI